MVEIKPRAAGLAALFCVLVGAAVPPAQAQGMRIVRDPVTGQLRAPTAEEYQAMQAEEAKASAARKAVAPAAAAPVPVRRADGSVKLMLDESNMSYSVVTRNADGSLTEQCVTGVAEAQKALSGKKVSVVKNGKNSKEHSHDHE